jgi:succinate dehydrogenase/fumarate reductase flavoprotein subunit
MSTSAAYDVIVLGSGASGLTAAFTAATEGARVAVFEKNARVGGTSAWSGGHVWIPAHHHMADYGAQDSVEDGVAYLMSLSGGLLDEALVRACVEAGPQMIRFLEEEGGVEFFGVPGLPDYHPENPGGRPGGGRTLGTGLFPYADLGEWHERVETCPYYPVDLRMDETPLGSAVPRSPTDAERARRAERDERGMGGGLVGWLLAACLRAGVEIDVGSPAVELVLEDGGVAGVVVEDGDGRRTVRATRGVILATGGFEWNEEYRTAFLRGPVAMATSIPTNTGDGLRMALDAGAALQNMQEAWWIPVVQLPPGINAMDREMINGDRTRPRSIMVNRHGRRFANEAANYNAFGGAFHQQDAALGYPNIPAWLIFDHTHLERYGSAMRPYAGRTPPWLTEAPTLAALAERLGIPADALEATVARWNAQVADGVDPDFHRGESAHDRWWGDPYRKGSIEGTLGPIEDAPFYAMELSIGTIGTKGGPKVDVDARVVGRDGEPIRGLYAVGNASSPMGGAYGGPGGTLGPGMTFGWLAGRHAAHAGASVRVQSSSARTA